MPIGKINKNSKEAIREEWKTFKDSYLKDKDFNLGIVCSFGYMVPSYVIDEFQGQMMVIHPSLLPKYRGATPIHHALMHDEKETGVSFIQISKRTFDAGDIVFQTKVDIKENHTFKELEQVLSKNSADNIIHVLQNFHTLQKVPQDPALKTPAPKLSLSDTFIDFSKSGKQIYNIYRGLNGSSFSSIRAKFQEQEIFFTRMSLPSEKEVEILQKFKESQGSEVQQLQVGQIALLKAKSYKNNIYIYCGNDSWISVQEWKHASGQKREAYKFIDQYLDKKAIIEFQKKFFFH